MDVAEHRVVSMMVGGLITSLAQYYKIQLSDLLAVETGLGDIGKDTSITCTCSRG